MSNGLFLVLLVGSIGLFFWGVARAVRTQRFIYALSFLPMFVLMGVMFLH